MDLIGKLQSQCDLPEDQARALAGGVLGVILEEMSDRFGFEAARSFSTEVPEVESWRIDALRYFGQAGRVTHGQPKFTDLISRVLGDDTVGVADMAGAASGGGATAEDAIIGAMLSELYAQPLRSPAIDNNVGGNAHVVGPLVLNFLHRRLSPTTFDRVLEVSPLMSKLHVEGGSGFGGAKGLHFGEPQQEP